MWRWLGVLCLLLGAGMASAQTMDCVANELGVNRVNGGVMIPVTNAAAVKVVNQDLKRCHMVLINKGDGPANCFPQWQGTPTSTVGVPLAETDQLEQGTSGRGAWYCIATTATATTILVLEEIPNVP